MGDKDRASSVIWLYCIEPWERGRERGESCSDNGGYGCCLIVHSQLLTTHDLRCCVERASEQWETQRGRQRGLIGSPRVQTALTTEASICFPESTEATWWSKIRVDMWEERSSDFSMDIQCLVLGTSYDEDCEWYGKFRQVHLCPLKKSQNTNFSSIL